MWGRLSLLFGFCLAEYFSIEFLNLLNTIPSNGVVYHYLPSMRPLELMWLDSLQAINPAIVDVDIAKLIVQDSASSRVIRKYHQAHKTQRAAIDYTYVFAMQVIYEDSQPVEGDITGFFTTASLKDSADWISIMNSHSITFQSAGLLHGDCSTAESECRDVTISSDFCYDAHVIPFDSNSQAEFDDRAANVTSSFTTSFNGAMTSKSNYVSNSVTVASITPNFPASSTENQNVQVGNEGDQFFAVWDFTKTTTENVHTVCMNIDTEMTEEWQKPIKNDQGWSDEVGTYLSTLDSAAINTQTVQYEYTCIAPACDPAPVPTQCAGNDTYNADLSDNGFLNRLGQGLFIVKVISGRGYLGSNSKPAVGFYDEPYGNDSFHLVGDTVRLGCKLGYSNGIAKLYSGASCQCADGVCGFQLSNTEFVCVSEDEQAIPVWTGGVFNFVKAVYTKYIVLKARVANLLSIVEWPFDRVDPDAHPEYLEESYWKTANFTLFVFCPFDVTLGGVASNTGLMTFPDFYPGEHSKDGFLWSFLSREGTKLWKPKKCEPDPENNNEIKCVWRSSYFKGFVDRSSNPSEQGPIEFSTDFQSSVDYSCETGILAGHHPHAIYNLEYYFPTFQNGSFSSMVSYLRNPPFDEDDL